MARLYVSSVRYLLVPTWTSKTYVVGDRVRPTNPAIGNERVYTCSSITTGVSGATEPTWPTGANSTVIDGGVTWTECTGQAIFNEDATGTRWGAPHARLANVSPGPSDYIYVSSDHAETRAAAISISLLSSSGTAGPVRIISIPGNVALPTIQRQNGASVTITSQADLTVFGHGTITGLTFTLSSTLPTNIAVGLATNNPANITFSSCAFRFTGVNGAAAFYLGANSSDSVPPYRFNLIRFVNCTALLSSQFSRMRFGSGRFEFINFSFEPGSVSPNTTTGLINIEPAGHSNITFRDSDLSACTTTLFNPTTTNLFTGTMLQLINCRLANAVTFLTNPVRTPGMRLTLHNIGATGTNFKQYEASYSGTIQDDTGVFLTNGLKLNGTTSLSMRMVTSAEASYDFPLRYGFSFPIDVVGSSRTFTVELFSPTANLSNIDVWMDLEFLNSLTSPQGNIISSAGDNQLITNPTLLTSSSENWTGLTGNAYKIDITVTPQQIGMGHIFIHLARPSTTLYVNPSIAVS